MSGLVTPETHVNMWRQDMPFKGKQVIKTDKTDNYKASISTTNFTLIPKNSNTDLHLEISKTNTIFLISEVKI